MPISCRPAAQDVQRPMLRRNGPATGTVVHKSGIFWMNDSFGGASRRHLWEIFYGISMAKPHSSNGYLSIVLLIIDKMGAEPVTRTEAPLFIRRASRAGQRYPRPTATSHSRVKNRPGYPLLSAALMLYI